MKYLDKLFAFSDRQSNQKSSATLTSTLYSRTFIPKSSSRDQTKSSTSSEAYIKNKISIVAHGDTVKSLKSSSLLSPRPATKNRQETKKGEVVVKIEQSGLGDHLLTTIIGDTKANTSPITSLVNQIDSQTSDDDTILIEDDWILVNNTTTDLHKQLKTKKESIILLQQMALDKNDVELIKASWFPVRKDPVASGILLFKGLFTKFPQYLKFFPQFSDLDIESIQENRRLLRHAVKVVETVTFVVDSVGDETKTAQLNEALINLVKGHLKRKIGLSEFRNLGIVLIDFICDINNRRGGKNVPKADEQYHQLNKSSTSDSSHSSNESETMTSALDKIRASSSSSSSSEEEGYMGGGNVVMTDNLNKNFKTMNKINSNRREDVGGATESDCNKEAKIDTNFLVAAWTKLYSSILDLVKREEGQVNDK